MTVNDRRKIAARPFCYVVATDSFLSGWGQAPGRSLYALAIQEGEDPQPVLRKMEDRPEMKRPRIVLNLTAAGLPKVRLHEGDHLSVRDSESAPSWYR